MNPGRIGAMMRRLAALSVVLLLALFVGTTAVTMLDCGAQKPKPNATTVLVPRDLIPDKVSPNTVCSQGSICGPVISPGICGAKCQTGETTGCCMNCQCIGSGIHFCAIPSQCGP